MTQEHVLAWNRETGERLAVIQLNKRKHTKRRFVMVFVDIPSFTKDSKISDFDRTLLMWIVSNMDETNELRRMQDEIAAEFKSQQPRISKAIKRLRDANYILTPRPGVIQVNAQFAWRSSLAENEKQVGLS